MWMRQPLLAAIGLVLLQPIAARAADAGSVPARGIREIPDAELNLMRGRYTVGDNTVAWFGVSMISTWQSQGQQLQSTLTLGMDFSKSAATPQVSFTPTVSITASDAPLPSVASSGTRQVDASGLQNVSGLVQSVQVAGDANAAVNATKLTVRDGEVPATQAASTPAGSTSIAAGSATASAGYQEGAASVLLQIAGQGQVQQWIRSGSVGQSIQLSSDGQQVSNQLQIDLVRQSMSGNTPLSQNVAQAISLTRGIGVGL